MAPRLGTRRVARGSALTALIAGSVSLPLVIAQPASAAINLCGHPADTVPPQISSVTFSALTADTSNGTTTVTVTADASDTATAGAGSGITRLFAYLTGPHDSFIRVKFHRASGTPDSGVWAGAATFTQQDWPGAYRLQDVTINDAAGNYQDYPGYSTSPPSPTAISLQTGWDSQLTLTGPTPTKTTQPTVPAGRLTAFAVSPGAVNTTTSTKRVVVTARFAGHQPRHVLAFFLNAHKSRRGRFLELHSRLHRTDHGWRGHVVVPQWVGNITLVANVEASFGAGRRPSFRDYDTSQLKLLGLTSSIAVTSTPDNKAPTLTALTFTPTSVDTHTGAQTVAVTASATDALSGVKRIDIDFNRHSNRGIVFADGSNEAGAASAVGPGAFDDYADGGNVDVRLTRTGSTWTGTATFRKCVPIGTWHVSASVIDNAGNARYLSGKRLATLKFPNTLQVAAAPQYVFDPVVVAATAAGAYHQITLDFDEGVENLTTSNLAAYAVSPAATRYQKQLTISAIACSNGKKIIDCSGSDGMVTSAVLTIPAVTGGRRYEVWADLGATTDQITDAGGLPVSWQYAIAQVRGA
jgi:hypothetical protein